MPTPVLTVHNDASAKAGQIINLSSLVTIADPGAVGIQKLELYDTNGTVTGGRFKINGVAQTGGHEIDVTSGNLGDTVFDAGTWGGSDTLEARLLQDNGTLTAWQTFTVTVPTPVLTVHNDASAKAGQIINLSSLVTIADPGAVGIQKLELYDTNGTVTGGRFKINGVAQTGGHEIDVTSGNLGDTVFDAGTWGGSDTLEARLLQDNGTLTAWQTFTVTVPTPVLTVHNDASAKAGQIINLSSLVTIADPGAVGIQKLELYDTNGTVTGGRFKINGVAQTGGHEIDVTSGNLGDTVFDAGTWGGSDTLKARLLQDNGMLTAWQTVTVTVPSPTLSVHNDSGATPSEVIPLSTLVTIADPGKVGYQKLELRDSNGTAAKGRFVVNGVAQGSGQINVAPGAVANTVFDVGTTGASDTLYARLEQDNGTLTAWQQFTVKDPLTVAAGATLALASAYAGAVSFAGSTGTLQLDASSAFSGSVAGMSGADTLDLRDIHPATVATPTYAGTSAGGTLTVTDGSHSANIALLGNYLASTFVATSDGHGGTNIVEATLVAAHPTLLTPPQHG